MSTATMDILDSNLFVDDDEVDQVAEENISHKEVKNKRKRNKKKKLPKVQQTVSEPMRVEDDKENEVNEENAEEKIEIELVPEEIKLDKNYEEFSKIFEHFRVSF